MKNLLDPFPALASSIRLRADADSIRPDLGFFEAKNQGFPDRQTQNADI